jgi:hypothetical protein
MKISVWLAVLACAFVLPWGTPRAVAADNEKVAAELRAIIDNGEPAIGNEDNDVVDRIRQIEVNLERQRWMDDNLGSYYIFVNVADQQLKVMLDGQTIHTARLVVGKRDPEGT